MTDWQIITGEYPPLHGGVGDYTRQVARALDAAGDAVTVWTGPLRGVDRGSRSESNAGSADDGVRVERLPDVFGSRSLRRLSRELDRRPAPRRLLVQYVPHAFGWRGANVPFCWWLRSRRRDSIWVMFHEVAFPFDRDGGLARNGLAAVNRMMAALVAGAAERAFVSIPGWTSTVQRLVGSGKSVDWLPVPSTIPVVADPAATSRVRGRFGEGRPIVGHFGTYGRSIRALLDPAIRAIVESTDAHVLLLGHQSVNVAQELVQSDRLLEGRLSGAGSQSPEDVSSHLAACDVLLQPYPDGVSSRRTSAMAALSHAVPMVTTRGWLTEPLWDESGAAILVPVDEPARLASEVAALLASTPCRVAMAGRAREMYDARFDLRHTVDALRSGSHANSARR